MRRWKREKKKNLPRKLHLCGQYMITISLLMKSSILLNFLLQIQAARHENRPSDLVSVRKLHSPNFVSYTKGLLLLYITDHRSPHQGVKPLQLRVALPSDLDCNVNNKGIVLCVLHWKTGTFWSSVQARLHNSSICVRAEFISWKHPKWTTRDKFGVRLPDLQPKKRGVLWKAVIFDIVWVHGKWHYLVNTLLVGGNKPSRGAQSDRR